MAAWFEKYIRQYLSQPSNDAVSFGVTIKPHESLDLHPSTEYAKCVGVHHLSGEENRGNHHIYLVLVDSNGNRIPYCRFGWTWVGKRADEIAPPIICDKPLNEPAGNISMEKGQTISVWTMDFPGDMVEGLKSEHPDEQGGGNTLYHHSFLLIYQLGKGDKPQLDPPPPVGVNPNRRPDGLYLSKSGELTPVSGNGLYAVTTNGQVKEIVLTHDLMSGLLSDLNLRIL